MGLYYHSWTLFRARSIILTISFLFIFSALQGFAGQAEPQSDQVITSDKTAFSVDQSNQEYTVLTFTTAAPNVQTIETEQGTFKLLSIPDTGYTSEVGSPQLPYLSTMLAVPDTQVTIEIISSKHYTMDVDTILPAQAPLPDKYVEEIPEFELNEEVYNANEFYPGEQVEIVDSGYIRVVPFVRIGFYPIQYNPVTGKAIVYQHLQVKVSWDPTVNYEVDPKQDSPHYVPFYENTMVNWPEFRSSFASSFTQEAEILNSGTGCEFLIITDPLFYDAAVDLQQWRIITGMDTWVVNTTETGTDEPLLKTYIQNAYMTWNPAPSYVLFFGDSEHIRPLYYNIHPYHGTLTGTDLWYFTIIGLDYYSEIFHGRIPVDTIADANTIVNEIINYEKNPPFHSGFYNNVTVAAYFQDDEHDGYETRRFVRTSEEVRDFLQLNLSDPFDVTRIYCTDASINPTNYNNGAYGNGEPLPPDLLRPLFTWDGDGTDIINRVNAGTLILNHRDHGSRGGWGDPYFPSSQISNFNNGELLPVVFSINCETGWFDHETDGNGATTTESFCEEFLRKADGGTVGIFGATRVSYSGNNDYLCRGFYDAMWPDFHDIHGSSTPMYRMGQVLNYGKAYMADTWGDIWGAEELTFELFHYFGDPTMKLTTLEPQDLNVTHPSSMYITENQVTVDVVQDDAYVVLTQGDQIVGTNYSIGGSAIIDLIPLIDDVIDVYVTKHNYRPYEGSIDVVANTVPWVDLTDPDSYVILAGGASKTIWWNMTDLEDPVSDLTADLYYSTDGGMTYPNTIVAGLTGYAANPCFYEWDPLPVIDSDQLKVRIVVSDLYLWTDTDESQSTFEIDSTAPAPADNLWAELEGTGVRLSWDASPSADVDHYEIWYSQNNWDSTGLTYSSSLPSTTGTDILHPNAGIMSSNCYFYQVRTYDTVGHEAITVFQAGKIGKTLSTFTNPSGWFMLGSYLTQSDYAIDHVLQGQGFPGTWDYVQTFDAWDNGAWHSYMKGRPDSVNDLSTIDSSQAFWLHITNNSRWAAAGQVTDVTLNLKSGWNLVPYSYAIRQQTAAQVEADLVANCPGFDGWRIFDTADAYRLINPSGTENLMQGDGLWVHVSFDTIWAISNY